MRQIHVCAWFLVTCLSACSGDEFTTAEGSDAASGADQDDNAAFGPGKPTAGSSSSGGAKSRGGASTAGSKSGGSSNAGGGPATSGGHEPGATCDGSVRFTMVPGSDVPAGYLCDAGCGTGWLTITDAQGAAAFSIFAACGMATCDACEPLSCAAAACQPKPLTREGNRLEWLGTYYEQDTCDGTLACLRSTCVRPGKYKARACAAVSEGPSATAGTCTPGKTFACAEAEFEFPGTREVKLVLKKP